MTDEIIKKDVNTVELIKKEVIYLDKLQEKIDSLITEANNIKYIIIPKGISQEIIDLIKQENFERELQKSRLLNDAKIIKEQLDEYKLMK